MVLAILPATTYSMHSRMLPLSIRRTYASPHTPLPLCLHSPFTARCQQRVKGLSGASSSRAAIKKSATTKLWLSTDRSNELSSVDTTFDGEQRVQEVGKYIDNDPVDITRSFEESSDDTDLNNGYRFSHNAARLEEVTDNMLDLDQHPPGSLSPDDIEMMAELMTMWSRRRSPTAAVTVEKLLKRVVDEMHAGSPHAAAETRMYVSCIDAWAKSGTSRAAATRAQSIHNKMVQTWKDASDPLLAPSTVSYNALMKAWGKCNEPDAPVMAEKVLTEMMAGSVHTKPDDVTFSTLLDAYAKSLTPTGASNGEAVFRCEELFYLMEAQLNIRPTVYTYSALQNVYVRSGMPDAALRAECTLHRMVEQYKLHGSVFAKPAAINYNAVLNALSKKPSRANAIKADAILQQMELPVNDGGFDVEPDRLSYALTILTCARCSDISLGVRRAEANLEKMEARARLEAQKRTEVSSAAPPNVSLDVECFNVVLTALSRCRQRDAPDRAFRIIQRMEKYAETSVESIHPNIRSWNAVLNALARASGSKDDHSFAQKAENTLDRLAMMHQAGVSNIKPDVFTYTAVLSAYLKSKDPEAAQRADNIVRRMESSYERGEIDTSPDTYHYTILCGTWARSGHRVSADRVLQILVHMVERGKAGFPDTKPNTRTFNAALDCLSRFGEAQRCEELLYYMLTLYRNGDDDAKPDSFSFNCVIQTFTKSKTKGAGKRAEMILDRLHEHQEEENPAVGPDARSFNLLIAYYGKSKEPDAPYRAEYLLNRMISRFKYGQSDLVPSQFAITTVIDSYSFAGHPDAGRNADRLLKLLRQLKQEYGASKLIVNTAVMNSVLGAWANCGDENAGQRAENYLDEMEASFKKGAIHMQPDTKSYGLVLSAWSKSTSTDKFRRALTVLRRMEQQHKNGNQHVCVDEHARSLVINTCGFSNADTKAEFEAFDIAITIFDEMVGTDRDRPTSLSFGWFIQAMGRLRVDEEKKSAQIANAFNMCCEAGRVNEFVLHRLKGAASDSLYKHLLEPVGATRSDKKPTWLHLARLPLEWKRNASNWPRNSR